MFSPSAQHAMRALLCLARRADPHPVQSREIAASEAIPPAYLSKILRQLSRGGLLRSTMGPGGGYTLARPAGDILVGEILTAVDELPHLQTNCVLGRGKCSDRGHCALHDQWKHVVVAMTQGIGSLTLEEIAHRTPAPVVRPARRTRTRGGRA